MGNFWAGGALEKMMQPASARFNLRYVLWEHIYCVNGIPWLGQHGVQESWAGSRGQKSRKCLGWRGRSENQEHRGCRGGAGSGGGWCRVGRTGHPGLL